MRIGELATGAGVSVQSIRFYERQGLLRQPPRTSHGYRNYNHSDLERISFIKWCKSLGFTLKEVKELMQLHAALTNLPPVRRGPGPRELQRIIRMAQEKFSDLQRRIKLLKAAGRLLDSSIKKLRSRSGPACPAATKVS